MGFSVQRFWSELLASADVSIGPFVGLAFLYVLFAMLKHGPAWIVALERFRASEARRERYRLQTRRMFAIDPRLRDSARSSAAGPKPSASDDR